MADPILRVSDLVTKYGRVTALKNIGFEAFQNEIIGVVGPNGSGKTTLLETIAGTLRSDEGRIDFLDQRLDRLSIRERRKLGLMMVPQENYVFSHDAGQEKTSKSAG